jgi:penicillin-binding protein 2
MDAEDYELYKPLGYPMDALIGKSGAEAAFEQYLHGVDGTKVVRTSEDGTVLEETITQEAVPGANVYLSIDIDVQKSAEDALAEKIRTINLTREEGQLVTGGAVVVTQVKTGEPLAIASYPSFDPATMLQNYAELVNDPGKPLLHRALQGVYSPGSTFKPVTALAGLRAGVITRYTPIEDKGQFTKYKDYRPKCWIYTQTGATHGTEDVVGALRDSCNYFFYKVGDDTGPSRIAQAARDFGFGAKTLAGISINEKEGVVATEEYKIEKLNEGWWSGDTLLVAIGQGLNQFTPIQLANYAATIADGGTLREMSLIKSAKSSDYTGTVYSHEPTTRSTIAEGDLVAILQEGMRAVAKSGTARDMFGSYPVPVAAKTGTVQTSNDYNNGVFICYAPADNPEIAISVVVEKGGSGAGIMEIAKLVMDEYFRGRPTAGVTAEGELIR